MLTLHLFDSFVNVRLCLLQVLNTVLVFVAPAVLNDVSNQESHVLVTKRSAESVTDALESRDRARAGFTAPAQGLFLWDVKYC